MIVDVDGLHFSFRDGWAPLKYDDSQFYDGTFRKVHDRLKAVDVVVMGADDHEGTLFLIEVKDYRHAGAAGKLPSELASEVALKVTSTLAGLVCASLKGANVDETRLASSTVKAERIVVVLHCENPTVPVVDPSDLMIKLRSRLADVMHLVTVTSMRNGSMPWSVSDPV